MTNNLQLGINRWWPPGQAAAEEFLVYSREFDLARTRVQYDLVTRSAGWLGYGFRAGVHFRNAIRRKIATHTPASYIRLGDGDGNVLFSLANIYPNLAEYCAHKISKMYFGNVDLMWDRRDFFGSVVLEAMRNADGIGAPEWWSIENSFGTAHTDLDVRGMCGMRGVYNYISDYYPLHNLTKCIWGSTWISRELLPYYFDLIRGLPYLGLVTCYDDLGGLLQESVAVERVETFLVPMQSSNARLMGRAPDMEHDIGHYPAVFEKITEALRPPYQGAVYFVAAGVLSKAYCTRIKERGGIAIDIGSVADIWMNIRSRPMGEDLVARWSFSSCGSGSIATPESRGFGEARAIRPDGTGGFPANSRLLAKEARIASARGNAAEAMRLAAGMRSLFPDDPTGYQIGSTAAREMLRFDEAMVIIAEGRTRFPDEAWPLAEVARTARARGNTEEAIQLASELRSRFPDEAAGYQIGSSAAREMRQFDQAAALIAEAIVSFPREAWPVAEAAWNAKTRGDAEEATRLAAELRGRFPDDPAGYKIGSAAAREMRRFDEAAALIAEAIVSFPHEAWPLAEAAWIARARGDTEEAMRLAAELRSRFTDVAAGYQIGSGAARETKRLDEAAAINAEAIVSFPHEAWPIVEAAWTARARGDADEAIRLAAELRSSFPDNPAGYRIASAAARQMRRLDEAAAINAEATARFLTEAWPLEEAARIARARGDADESVRLAAELRNRFPDSPSAMRSVRAVREMRRLDEAAAIIAEGASRLPAVAWPAAEAEEAPSTGRRRCSQVHDSLYIDDRGDVFACCHSKPGVVGNIYKSTLKEIYNSDSLKRFRQREIDGTLACVKNCNLRQTAIKSETVERDYHEDLRYLKVLFSERCNIKCIMCNQDHMSKLELDDEKLVNNVEIPRSCDSIVLQGGETLILRSAKRFFDHCAAHGSKVSLLTNGTAMSEEMAKKIALHCECINFSLNGATKETHEIVNAGSKFDKVLRNLRRVIQAKRELNGNVKIWGHMTIVPANVHEITEFIRKQTEFGFERINFGFDTSVLGLFAEKPAMKADLSIAIKAEIAKASHKDRIDTARLHMLGLV